MGLSADSYQARTAFSIEEAYDEMQHKLDIEHWENKRGPRPWEQSADVQEQLRRDADERKRKLELSMKEEKSTKKQQQ